MYSWTLITLATLAINLVSAAPAPWDKDEQNRAAYTGTGGDAKGGDIANGGPDNSLYGQLFGGPLLQGWSGNAGSGGQANSGGALVSGDGLHEHGKFPQTENVDAYSGKGGDTDGGSYNGKSGIIGLFADNAGQGGIANSGSSVVDPLLAAIPGSK